MKYNKKELATKAMAGDEEAMGMLILVSPSKEMGDMSCDDYAKHVSEGEDQSPEEDVGAVMDILLGAGLDEDQAMDIGSGIFEALGYY